MPVAATPSFTATISAAMQEAGRLNVSFSEVSSMSARGAQDVKTDLWFTSRYDLLLATETMVVVTTGNSVYTLPAEFDHEYSLRVYYGDVRGRAQSGTGQQITLASADTSADDAYIGWYAFTLAGTGSGQWNQIADFTGDTDIASLTAVWTTPDSTTDYLIGSLWHGLIRDDRPFVSYARWGSPQRYRITGNSLTVWPPPDKVYPIVMAWGPNLTRLDDTSTIFLKWLRERRSLFVQGIKVKTMALFDDDRYERELNIYERMKMQYAATNSVLDQTDGSR